MVHLDDWRPLLFFPSGQNAEQKADSFKGKARVCTASWIPCLSITSGDNTSSFPGSLWPQGQGMPGSEHFNATGERLVLAL